jgi:asparagine synthase (glutamine-hydrolysing)
MNAEHDATYSPGFLGERVKTFGVGAMVTNGDQTLTPPGLSAAGHQPMSSLDDRLWITYNGEIYNFLLLRDELERAGVRFRSRSDTEVILALYARHGPDCLARLRGMFALAIWDRQERTLFLARDRLGKKPLFYYQDADRFVFASEPKAILQDPEVAVAPDPVALHHYLTYGYVPGPWSAFRGVRKLPPAHYLVLRDGQASLHRYWALRHTPKRSEDESALIEELLHRLGEAVRLRLISDVPVGALLSGGLDSSAVVALIRRVTSGPIRTFSIGFREERYDELGYAALAARHFRAAHYTEIVGPEEAEVQKGLLSISAPLGKALIGREAGDSIEVNTPRGTRYFEILEVAYPGEISAQ